MLFFRAALLVFLCWSSGLGASCTPAVNTPEEGDFTFELVNRPEGHLIPGDLLQFAFLAVDQEQIFADSFTLVVRLPQGLLLEDTFWSQEGDLAYRQLPGSLLPNSFPVDLWVRIASDFKGKSMTVSGFTAGEETPQKTISFGVAEVLNRYPDTCFFLQDTTDGKITTIMASRTVVEARLRGPIDLSPIAPIRVSHKGCPAFNPSANWWERRKNAKCTALHFVLDESDFTDYPDRIDPGKKKIQDTLRFGSSASLGDTFTLSVKSIKGKLLRGVTLTDGQQEILDAAPDVPGYQLALTLDTAFLNRTLHLRARRILGIFPLRQNVLLDATRQPATRIQYRDTGLPPQQPLGDTLLLLRKELTRKVQKIRRDTGLLYDTLVQHKEIVALRNQEYTLFYGILSTESSDTLTPVFRDTISRDTCIGNFNVRAFLSATQKIVWVPTDTLLYQAVAETQSVVGFRNPLGASQGVTEVRVPREIDAANPDTRDTLITLAYWIGIGEPAIAAYSLLADEVPADWTQPGITAPLAAFSQDYPVVLPGLPGGDVAVQEQVVKFDFLSQQSRAAFQAGLTYTPLIFRDPTQANFGVLYGRKLRALFATEIFDKDAEQRLLRFFLAYKNQHQVNTYRVQLFVVAHYQVRTPEERWVAPQP